MNYSKLNRGMKALPYAILKYSMLASLILAFILLAITFNIVPAWLYFSLTSGTVAYLLTFVGVIKRVRISYYASGVLAAVILAVGLSAPAHFRFIEEGLLLQSGIFILGSLAQVIILINLGLYAIKSILRRR